MTNKSELRARRVEALVRMYQRGISPLLHALGGSLLPMRGGCRYLPTCSEYAAVAVARHGWVRGTAMGAWRVCRCHPWSKGGFDPVP